MATTNVAVNMEQKQQEPVLLEIPVSKLRPHPKNPRLIMRDDVIEAIKAGIQENGGFSPKFAISVQPIFVAKQDLPDHYIIISGHHRVEAAKQLGISSFPCWVEEMDSERAYMELATSNSQGELSPLEIGMHALHYVPKASGGRGKKGGLSEYAVMLGKSQDAVSLYRKAGAVVQNIRNVSEVSALLDKAAHLAALHSLPESIWPDAVQTMLSKGWSAKETGEQVKAAQAGSTDKRKIALLSGRTSTRELARIDQLRFQVSGSLEFEDIREEWMNWLDENDPTDIKQVQAKRIELEDKEAERRASQEDKEDETSLPNLILADPPWRYDFAQSDSRQIENQYPSASVEEIIAHRPDTAPDCVLFLWATVAKLPQAMEVMEGWGFEYKTHAVWDKEKIGMGYWFRGQHELLLVGTRGKAEPPDEEFRVSSVFREKRNKHSAKPDCIYDWIEKAFPGANKLEMYCRSPRPGWIVFGNESKKVADHG